MTAIKPLPGQAGLPTKNSTQSYWHKEPSTKLLGHRTTSDLPTEAEVVVIGSGITGAFAARELVGGGKDVLMLEAREACWGATGRNGGHCQPQIYLSEPEVARFELATFDFLSTLITENDIDCSWEQTGGVHSVTSPEMLSLVIKYLDELRKSHPDLADKAKLITDREQVRKLRLRDDHAVAAVFQPFAAKCWPYKLVSWVLETLLSGSHSQSQGRFNLQTSTPVVHLQQREGTWIVHTDRGQVSAKHVLLATNAYTSFLLPKFTGAITPVRGQVGALIPPVGSSPLAHTHVWKLQEKGDVDESADYLIQRPSGELILGGERFAVPDGGERTVQDDVVDPEVARRLRSGLTSALHLSSSDPHSLDASYEWTGIMGYSADESPWVGRVPEGLGGDRVINSDRGGLWISAGYTGHGMPVAARCGIAVAERILGKTDDTVKIPSYWEVTEERFEALQGLAMPRTVDQRLQWLIAKYSS